jgi:hypothetical protein
MGGRTQPRRKVSHVGAGEADVVHDVSQKPGGRAGTAKMAALLRVASSELLFMAPTGRVIGLRISCAPKKRSLLH